MTDGDRIANDELRSDVPVGAGRRLVILFQLPALLADGDHMPFVKPDCEADTVRQSRKSGGFTRAHDIMYAQTKRLYVQTRREDNQRLNDEDLDNISIRPRSTVPFCPGTVRGHKMCSLDTKTTSSDAVSPLSQNMHPHKIDP